MSFYPANKKFYYYGLALSGGNVLFAILAHAFVGILISALMEYISVWFFPLIIPVMITLFITIYVLTYTNIYDFSYGNRDNVKRIEKKYLNLPKKEKREYSDFLDAVYQYFSKNHHNRLSHDAVKKFEKILDMYQPAEVNPLEKIEKLIDERYQQLEDYYKMMKLAPEE